MILITYKCGAVDFVSAELPTQSHKKVVRLGSAVDFF